tara:strand:+ start:229 stop:972 length:744 start_codon:yes stop_codon:yes gene_type:complete
MDHYLHYFNSAIEASRSVQIAQLMTARPQKRARAGQSSQCSIGSHSLGTHRLALIRQTLESGFDMQRSNTQKQFHDSFLNACCRFLFSDDTNAPDFTDIMQANGWDDLRQQVLCMTPRRFGKTTAVSMYVAAIAWHVPSEQAIFSTGRRASSKLLEQVLGLLRKLPGADDRIVKANQEMIWISHPGGKLAKISSYPSCAKTLRGVGGHIIYMEEAAFMDLAVFYEVIVPLLEVRLNGFFLLLTGCSD